MAGDVIKEFLVSLGYRVEANQEKKFAASVGSATNAVVALGAAAAAASAAVSAAVIKISRSFDGLYWQAQRTQTTVSQIKAISYAVSQLGGSADEAGSSIESFGKNLKWNPGFEGFLKQIGVVTRSNGQLRDSVSLMKDFASVLKGKSRAEQMGLASFAGIDLKTLEALQSGEYEKHAAKHAETLKRLGVNEDEAARKANALQTALGQLNDTLAGIGTLLLDRFGPSLTQFFEKLNTFILDNSDKIVAFFEKLGRVAGELYEVFEKILGVVGPLWQKFDNLTQSIAGVDGLTAALVALIGLKVMAWLLGVAAGIKAVGTAAGVALLGGALGKFLALFGIGAAGALASGSETQKALESGSYQVDPNTGGLVRVPQAPGASGKDAAAPEGSGGGWGKLPQLWGKVKNWWSGGKDASGSGRQTGVGGSRSWRNNNPGNIEYSSFARRMGATGSDGRFAIFPDYETGRKAQEELLFNSAGYRNLTLAQAIGRWAPSSENNVQAYIDAMGGDPGKMMHQYSAEERKKLLDAMQKHEGWKEGRPTAGPGLLKSVTGAAKSAGITVTSGYRSPFHPLSLANPRSAHARGMAFDARAKTPDEADAEMAKIRSMMSARGLEEGRDYKIIDEVRNPSGWATAPHVHTELTASGAKLWGGAMPKYTPGSGDAPGMGNAGVTSPDRAAADKQAVNDNLARIRKQMAAEDLQKAETTLSVTGFEEELAKADRNAAKATGGGIGDSSTALAPPPASTAGTNVTVNQENHVNITGSGDPHDTAQQIGQTQRDVNGGLVRDLKGAVR